MELEAYYEHKKKVASTCNPPSPSGSALAVTASPVKLMQSRIQQQEERCRHLQIALKQQQLNSQLILKGPSVTLDAIKEKDL